MKFKYLTLTLIIASMGFVSCKKGSSDTKSPSDPKLKTQVDSLSYALGLLVGDDLKNGGFSALNYDILNACMKRAMNGDSLQMDKMTATTILQKIAMEEMKKKSSENEKSASDYMEKNKSAEGVVTTASGLQYKILKAGTGPKPADSDTVRVHYTGKLIDGKVFDSSVDRGEPATFGVNMVIKGWTEALKLMPVGSKWQLIIPPSLAYGDQASQAIPANSVLLFDVELLEIIPAAGN